ncbi:metal ABC transporter permease [Leucobacter soli]|uniref:Manganese transport system membrane protein MntB n=1 Tax=Leucobacter soli TaxID=2812850 RepID=A0A916NGZ0_9MICO|nr:metal ABC transporter permease [Leucobacter soli]CAG7605917.1 Manganese transport system membrane protein MntB [Leucobacter soli]
MDVGLLEVFALPFMARALATVAILAVAAGVVGLGISFREMEFVSDGVVHAVFPGLVIGAALGGSAGLLPGAVLAALIAAVLFALLGGGHGGGRRGGSPRADGDAAIAVVLTGLFSLGVVLVSRQEGYVSQLQELLFGRLLTVTAVQLWQILAVAILAIGIMLVTRRAQIFRAFDPEGAEAAGYSPRAADLALTAAIALLTVAGVQALGVLMVVALLTVPMAVSRLATRRLRLLVPVAVLVPLVAGVAGLWLAFDWSVRTGATISPGALVVLLLVALYALAVLIRSLAGRIGAGAARPAGGAR